MSTIQTPPPPVCVQTEPRDERLREELFRRRDRFRWPGRLWKWVRSRPSKRFGLRTLLGFMLLVAATLGFVLRVEVLGYHFRYEPELAAALTVCEEGGNQELALRVLAHAREWPAYHREFEPADRVVPIVADARYAVVIKNTSAYLLKDKTIELLLLDQRGDILDSMDCTVHAELVFEENRALQIERPDSPRNAGADFIFRAVPISKDYHVYREKFAYTGKSRVHYLNHEGKTHIFSWDAKNYPSGRMPDWETFGLCRVTVRNGRIEIVHPRLD